MTDPVYLPPIGNGKINEELYILRSLTLESLQKKEKELHEIYRRELIGYCRALYHAGIITKDEKRKLTDVAYEQKAGDRHEADRI